MPDKKQESNIPLAYLITITCYGNRLHGDQQGTVDPKNNIYDTPFIPENLELKKIKRKKMKQDPYQMDQTRREIVHETIIEVCKNRGWFLIAGHVRSSHFHAVIHACRKPHRVMNDVKSYASRRLNETGIDHYERKRWARHGSGIYLYRIDSLQSAIQYTIHRQGEPMAVYLHHTLDPETFDEYCAETNRKLRSFLQQEDIINERGVVVIHD